TNCIGAGGEVDAERTEGAVESCWLDRHKSVHVPEEKNVGEKRILAAGHRLGSQRWRSRRSGRERDRTARPRSRDAFFGSMPPPIRPGDRAHRPTERAPGLSLLASRARVITAVPTRRGGRGLVRLANI